MRVLIAEDDAALRSVLERGLVEEGYTVDVIGRGDDALEMLRRHEYAVAVLDWRMPGISGIDTIAAARRSGIAVPILMLTALDTPADRVRGLDSGADDYLVKPFDFDEFLARLRALQRRPPATAGITLGFGNISVDPSKHEVVAGGQPLTLTPREFAVLEVLIRRAPHTVARAAIANHAWHEQGTEVASNTMDVHIARLRIKLGTGGVTIQATRGIGYRLVEVPGLRP